jgi:2-dehydro-3-deoxyphosphooctonate aldolase (KDO 8-P synthase)
VRHFGGAGVFVTERGISFGPYDLVVDMRGLVQMRRFAPVCYDATHSVQQRDPGRESVGGDRQMVPPLARAAVAVGIDALFVEVHPDPERAPCDRESQLDLQAFETLLADVLRIDQARRGNA